MAWYTIDDVRIEGKYPVEKILDIALDVGVNRHGTLTYSGLIPKDEAIRYVQQDSDKQAIKVYICDKLEFCGYPEEIHTEWANADAENNHCRLQVKLVTSGAFADIHPRERFYQDTNRTFDDIISEALEDSGVGEFEAVRGKTPIGDVILQYRETDWQFALRMASRLGTLVIPDVVSEEPKFWLGIPEQSAKEEPNDISYQMGRDITEFRAKYNESSKFMQRIKKLQDVSDFHNFLHYKMKSENRYKLGDSVTVDGKILTVMQKTFAYEKGGIEEIYTFGSEQEFAVPFHHNKNIAGLELIGTVLERDGQRIKMLLDIDAKRKAYEKTWFCYSPVTNNAMYSMPLEGESVMLGWQSEADHDVLILRPARKNGSTMPPHVQKHFLTEHEQHMMMASGIIEYKNPTGNIQWLESMGFNISTAKDFALMADKDIVIKSGDQVEIRSPERITAGKTDVPSSIDMIGGDIHIAAKRNVVQKSGVKSYKAGKIPKLDASFEIRANTAKGAAATLPLLNNAKQSGETIVTLPVVNKNLPVNNGSWSDKGKPGNSIWQPLREHTPLPKNKAYNNPDELKWGEILDKYNIDGVPFTNKQPDFSQVSKGDVKIEGFSADRSKNFNKARRALAERKGCEPKDVGEWMKANGYVWHECEDMTTMQKLPHEVHANIPHSGGIAEFKRRSSEII
jgi:hypothetical protein